jgi:hypothetical protein
MNGDYKYMHIPGSMPDLSSSVTYAALFYLIVAIVAIVFWVRAARKAGQLTRATAFTPLS